MYYQAGTICSNFYFGPLEYKADIGYVPAEIGHKSTRRLHQYGLKVTYTSRIPNGAIMTIRYAVYGYCILMYNHMYVVKF